MSNLRTKSMVNDLIRFTNTLQLFRSSLRLRNHCKTTRSSINIPRRLPLQLVMATVPESAEYIPANTEHPPSTSTHPPPYSSSPHRCSCRMTTFSVSFQRSNPLCYRSVPAASSYVSAQSVTDIPPDRRLEFTNTLHQIHIQYFLVSFLRKTGYRLHKERSFDFQFKTR